MKIIKRNQEKRKNGKKLLKKIKKQAQGITLIALVVTVIVLLILAGVAINLTVGDNGLFKRAQNAADTYQETSEREAIELAVAGMQIGSMHETGMTKTELENSLKEQFGDEVSVEDNEDGSFLVTIGENQYYVGEDGEIIDSSNMIEISTVEELKTFRDDVNNGNTYEGKYVYLTNDIILDSSEEWEPIGLYPNDSSTPDDEDNKPFSGIFDGKNHEIDGIYINTTDKVQGLFGLVKSGKIMNLDTGLNCNIKGGNASSGIVGYLCTGAVVNKCNNKSNINGKYTGGVVGYSSDSKILNSHNTGKITGEIYTGGVVGMASNLIILNCYNIGSISGTFGHIGGIVGQLTGGENSSTVLNCYNSGNIEGGYFVGGIAGSMNNNCVLESCYNNCEFVVANSKTNADNACVGGIVGINTYSKIKDVYNIGEVKGEYNGVGGIVGINRGDLSNSYNIGTISGSEKGGIVGVNDIYDDYKGIIKNSYCLDEINLYGINKGTISEECSSESSINLKSMASILGESFKEDTNNINSGYPILKWQ